MGKTVAVVIREKERQNEGLRFSLGLLLEQHQVAMFVLDHEIEASEEYMDNMGFIDEMGGARYSNHPVNVERHGFQSISLDEVGSRLDCHELIVPF
jgi:hypothetical protein